jgi:hypothetical protein
MYHIDWFKLRYELTRDYPGCLFDVGCILDAFVFEGKITLYENNSIFPNHFKDHFRLLRWWEHRTIEQFLTIKYMKVVSGSNYYVKEDIIEVTAMHYNDASFVGGRGDILFDLKGHHFMASELEPATKEQYDKFKTQ